MKAFVDRGLFDDVSDLWKKNKWDEEFKTTLSAMTVDGKQWGIPTTYSFWGIFYRKDIFEKLGIAVPKTWEEFVAAAKKLKENDIIPFTIGTKDVWTPAGWFDILNMRINGYDFHMQLMDGKVPYTDERVKEVFAKWKELVDGKFYLPNNYHLHLAREPFLPPAGQGRDDSHRKFPRASGPGGYEGQNRLFSIPNDQAGRSCRGRCSG